MSNLIAIIPARGGSKRIPRKNIVDFCGKPMIAWTIEAAREAAMFDRIVVSTDDPEIADVARSYGAEVPFLRNDAADDNAPVAQATLAALAQSEAHWQERYTTVVQLMPNCPLRDAADIMSSVERFRDKVPLFLVSCFQFGWNNPWWAHRIDSDGRPVPLFPEAMTKRSQDLDALYCPTGAVWVADTAALAASGTFYGPGFMLHPISWISAVDIDDPEDFEMARAARMTRERLA